MENNLIEIRSAYDTIVRCILENINNDAENQQHILQSNWKYVKYSIERFMDAIMLEGKQNKEPITLSINVLCTFVQNCLNDLNVKNYNNSILFQMASIVKIIFVKTSELDFAIQFCDEFTDSSKKVSCLYFLLIIYLYNVCYINDDYNKSIVKKELHSVLEKINGFQHKQINDQQIGDLNKIFVTSVREYKSVSFIIFKMKSLCEFNEESIIDLIEEIICEK